MHTRGLDGRFKKKNGAVDGKKVYLTWEDDGIKAFHCLREIMMSDRVLIMPDFLKEFELHTDASDYGYGAALVQERNKKMQPIAFYSKSMTKSQIHYSVSEKELLAIVMSVEHFHQYLYGTKFIIRTDHQPLAWLLIKKDPAARLARWIIRISNYDFKIIYKQGILNGDADALSRWLGEPSENNVEEPEDE